MGLKILEMRWRDRNLFFSERGDRISAWQRDRWIQRKRREMKQPTFSASLREREKERERERE